MNRGLWSKPLERSDWGLSKIGGILDSFFHVSNESLCLNSVQGLHQETIIFVETRFHIVFESLIFHLIYLILISYSVIVSASVLCGAGLAACFIS